MSALMAHHMETIPKLSDKRGLLLHSSLPVTATSPSHLITVMRITRAFLFFSSAIIPLHQYAYSPYSSRYISNNADKENLFINREPLEFAIIPSIFVTLMCASGVIL